MNHPSSGTHKHGVLAGKKPQASKTDSTFSILAFSSVRSLFRNPVQNLTPRTLSRVDPRIPDERQEFESVVQC